MVELLSLTFNHDPNSARNSAINIRVDGDTAVEVPEWRAGRGRQFPAAYSILDTAGAAVLLEATLSGPPGTATEVAAVPSTTSGSHVLGPIQPRNVGFGPNGLSGTVRFELAGPAFLGSGIGSHVVSWRWIHRTGAGAPWTAFADTAHDIFTILRTPTLPWLQLPVVRANTQLPWADALRWSCRWAAGCFEPSQAATAITLALFALGGERFRYSCVSGAPSNYSFPEFDCSGFLERLAGGIGRGPNVNCSDCATIVSTFANAVGCDLSQARMFNQVAPFAVNAIRLIGQPAFGAVCGTGFFNYHEVAWDGHCTEADEVYDACVALLAPPPPWFPAAAVVPANVFFGFPNQGLYRDLLAAPLSRVICQPQPALSRIRRLVF